MTIIRAKQILLWSENAINANCVFSLSSGTGSENIYDQKRNTTWLSSGSSDSITESVKITFYNKFNVASPKIVDRVAVLGTNAKDITVKTISGEVETFFASVSGNSASDVILTGTAVDCDGISVYITATQTANEEKYIGELKACRYLTVFNALTELEQTGEWLSGDYRTRSGALVTWREYEKNVFSLNIKNMSVSLAKELKDYITSNSILTYILLPDLDDSKIFELALTEPIDENFDRPAQLYEFDLTLKER